MIKLKDFALIQKLKNEGLSKQQTIKTSGLKAWSVRKYWDYTEGEFLNAGYRTPSLSCRASYVEKHKPFLLKELERNPKIKNSVLLDKIKEQDPEFSITASAFYRYMLKLRELMGIQESKRRREFEAIGDTKAGEWAQVDFGEITLCDMYSEKVKVYFYAIVLMFSRYKFFCIQREPYTTKAFIEAMEKSFRFFGGVPKTIMFDQARVMVVAENCGNILFTEKFDEYKTQAGFNVYLCKAYDPDTKGRVENVIRFIKYNFFGDKEYCGIDVLNSEALAWLDRTGNGQIHGTIKKIPREEMDFERLHLLPHKPLEKERTQFIAAVTDLNYVLFKKNYYTVPAGKFDTGEKVRLEIDGEMLNIFTIETNELVARHKLLIGSGNTSKLQKPEAVKHEKLIQKTLAMLDFNTHAKHFVDKVIEDMPRYTRQQCYLLQRIANEFDSREITQGIEWCKGQKKFDATELLVFLTKTEKGKAEKVMPKRTKKHYAKRAEGLAKYMMLAEVQDEK